MKIHPLKSGIIILLMSLSMQVFSQQNKAGGSVIYNLSTKSLGFSVRAEFPIQTIDLLEGISLVPQVSYFPGFNPISEFYIGSAVHLYAYSYNRWKFYGILSLAYNGWINNEDIAYRTGEFSNLAFEIGAGVSHQLFKCMHPFFEFRYNFIWNEPHVQLGMMYTLRCDRRGAVPCSKIPPQPTF